MGFFETIKLALTAIKSNKMRSFLTMLGIIIGISSVITITTIGTSIEKTLSNTFNSLGVNIFDVYLEPNIDYNAVLSGEEIEYPELDEEDVITEDMINELYEKYPGHFDQLTSSPVGSGEARNSSGKKSKVTVLGVSESYAKQYKLNILYGRGLTQRDDLEHRSSCLVSDIFVRQYFKEGTDPLGKTVDFVTETGKAFEGTIVGVYEYSASIMGAFSPAEREEDKMTTVYIPTHTAKDIAPEMIEEDYLTYISIMWNTDYEPEMLRQELQDFFDEKYETNTDWTVIIENESDMLKQISAVLNVITVAISVIAAISLLVGGVGVMNIMLVSVVERTREIGIEKALGAKEKTIRRQFLIESVVICLIGGVIGILIGILNGVLIGKIAESLIAKSYSSFSNIFEITISPSIKAIVISVLFSMLVGVFFGSYPAKKAAALDPIEALRYE